MITTNAARLLGLQHYALDVGGPATLVLFNAVSGADAVARLSPVVTGWKNGRQTFLRPASRLLFGQQHQNLDGRLE
ncbi:hypothetical protein AB9F46_11980 [Rhizobium leguminosarum]|uniref:hypothetical protein n=1 Tax=Rhizobium leguminosarum TaxID=384 RepID=UPI003F958B5E